jgi:hypothetical protein
MYKIVCFSFKQIKAVKPLSYNGIANRKRSTTPSDSLKSVLKMDGTYLIGGIEDDN